MPKHYKVLTLRIIGQPPAQAGPPFGQVIQIAVAPDHSSCQGLIQLTPDTAAVNKIAILKTEGNDLQNFGKALFEQIFEPHKFRPLYNQVRGKYDEVPQVGLRIQVISEDMGPVPQDRPGASLQQLPWEYLYDPARDRFLALDAQHLSLVRSLANVGACVPLPTSRPLRLLTVLANAKVGGGPRYRIDIDQERQLIEQAAKQAGLNVVIRDVGGAPPQAPNADVLITHLHQVLDQQGKAQRASRTALKRYLRDCPAPHTIHFCCHGSFDPMTREGQLVLEKNAPPGQQGNKDPLPARQLKEWLSDIAPDLRLVVFNACSTAPTRNVAAFKSVAEAAVQAGVPAVVAMQFDIPMDIASEFTRSFNQQLFSACLKDGEPIDLALARAREDIATHLQEHLPHWGIPVLYRHPSGIESFRQVPAGKEGVARDLMEELDFLKQQRATLRHMAHGYDTGQVPNWLASKLEQVEQRIQALTDQDQALVEGGQG